MKIAIIVINKDGDVIARKIKKAFNSADIYSNTGKKQQNRCSVTQITEEFFNKEKYEGLVYIAASGIVVRSIAPFIKNKYDDPAVVCVDTSGRSAISLLSGHEGGANRLTYKVAAAIGAQPVITTGTEVHKKYIIGIGCRKGISKKNIFNAIDHIVDLGQSSLEDVRLVASVDIKINEKGLVDACDELALPLVFINKEKIKRFKGEIVGSQAAKRHFGIVGVCEPCALIAGRRTTLILQKQVINGVTVALAKEN
ncbi:MAG: cobalamin biosynthesis protein [Candidatus Omnitrophica bacterium]|nr:cobalamin biosynthesis protein [Candidatus Omnitrophota bacterium]